jgi:hypothetical protein
VNGSTLASSGTRNPRQPISSPVAAATPDTMPVVPVRTTNSAITTQSGALPKPNASAVVCTKSLFGNRPKPKIQMPSDATRQ